MRVEQHLLDSVNTKLNKQNAIRASIYTPFFSLLVLIFWYILAHLDETIAPVMLILSGVCIGAVVRLYGKGFSLPFSAVAIINHLILVLAAFSLQITLMPGKRLWVVVYFGFYLAGAWLAAYLARVKVPFYEHKAYYKLVDLQSHNSFSIFRNRWYIVVPCSIILALLVVTFTAAGINEYRFHKHQKLAIEQQNKAYEQRNSRALDVTPNHLKNIASDEILKHVYAYHTGYFPATNWKSAQSYPRSRYKAKTLLNYLISQRNEARAKFILGIVEFEENGYLLIQQADTQGDIFAKVFQAQQFGCFNNKQLAVNKLKVLKQLAKTKIERKHIQYALKQGFSDRHCTGIDEPAFLIDYVL